MTIMDMMKITGIIRSQSVDMPCVCYTCIRVSALTFIFESIRRESRMIRTCDNLRHSDPVICSVRARPGYMYRTGL